MPQERAIVGFHRDGEEDWVADLSCGHTQHVPHRPPFQSRPWVTTEAGRAEHLGRPLLCTLCDMPELPAGLTHYRSTDTFDEVTLPAGLRRAHTLRAGTWGVVVVLEGRLLYEFEDGSGLSFVLNPDFCGVVPPEIPHRVAPRGPVRLRVDFYR